jgi:high affinity sulfate transporter 1
VNARARTAKRRRTRPQLRLPAADAILGAFPTIRRLHSGYDLDDLRADGIAGIALTAVLVPVGMGYAQAAGLPAIAGLYATIGALTGYFLVGPSRILVVGPDSSLLPLFAAAVIPLAGADPGRAVALAGGITLIAGLLCLLAAVARLGFLTDLLSRPVRIGYINAIAVIIIAGQLPKLLGFGVSAEDVLGQVQQLVAGIRDGKAIPEALVLGVGGLVAILVLRRFVPLLPGALVAVAAAGAIVVILDLEKVVPTVGLVPQGLPVVGLPAVSWSDVLTLFPTAVAIAVMSFADTSVLSHTFAARRGERVDADQELAALGVTQISASLVGGFAASGSATRTPVAEQAGARTQLASLTGAAAILALLVFVPGLLEPVPNAALAAVVIAAALSLVDVSGVVRLWRIRRTETLPVLVAFVVAVLFGALPGIAASVLLSLLIFVRNAWAPYDAVLGRVGGYKGYHDLTRHPEGRAVPGLLLYRWDAPLFFANAEVFREHLLEAVHAAKDPVRWIAVAAEPITDVDTTAADTLDQLIEELRAQDVELHFAEMKGRTKDRLRDYGIFQRLGADHFHPTVGSVVTAYLEAHPDVHWTDWEDEPVPPEQASASSQG